MKFPRITQAAAALTAIMASCAAFAQVEPTEPVRWQLNMTPGVTSTAANAYSAHMIMLWICVIIGVIVFGAMAVAMIPAFQGRQAGYRLHPQHQAGTDLDHHPDHHPGGFGLAGHAEGDGPVQRQPEHRKR
jgi:heme/copper-type cytochrome/quinol oxidase subunit 2